MFFRDVIGQEEIKQRLIQEVSEGRIPHAQLICGPEGVGKMPLAIAYARYISCTNRGETDACGVCPSCVKFNKLVHPDVHFVFPIVKSSKGETGSVRRLYRRLETIRSEESVLQPESLAERNGCRECTGHHLRKRER